MTTPFCSVSIDLDPIDCYYGIHGLGPPPEHLRDLVMRTCLPRFVELFASRGIPATFFVVGRVLDGGPSGSARANRDRLADLVGRGHEVGNHSHTHPYSLARMSVDEVRFEMETAHQRISQACGRPVVGFRAPGYDLSKTMLAEAMRLGYVYDSSILPAPGYYAAKAAIMGAMKLAGRKSGAVLTSPLALLAPANPYRPSPRAPWRRGQATLVEMPIAVTPWGRTPAIGTSVLLAPEWLRTHWLTAMTRRPFFNFELHGIDLADADEDGIPGELVSLQPDLRVPLARKRQVLGETLDAMARTGTFVTLADAARWAHREIA